MSYSNKNLIEDEGIVKKIVDNTLFVEIMQKSACSECHAKGVCSSFDSVSKLIEVKSQDGSRYSVGDQVVLILERSLGFLALFWGYLAPFILFLFAIITLVNVGFSDEVAALISLSLLVPYYFFLYLMREKLKKKFSLILKED